MMRWIARIRSRHLAAFLVNCGLAVAIGCAPAMSSYVPQHVGPAELTLRYDQGMVVYSGHSFLTKGPTYRGLAEHVSCVPRAYEHARYAQKHGRARRGLAWSGGALGVASLGGLSGFAFLEDDRKTAFALLGTGLAVAVLGIVLAGASRSAGNQAHGNAIDAINYYNDAVGSVGGSCAAQAGAPPIALLPSPHADLAPAARAQAGSGMAPPIEVQPGAGGLSAVGSSAPSPSLGAYDHNGGLTQSSHF